MEKENRKVKNNVFVDLFYEDQSAEANMISLKRRIQRIGWR